MSDALGESFLAGDISEVESELNDRRAHIRKMA